MAVLASDFIPAFTSYQANRLADLINNGGGGGTGTVLSVSVASANGLAGTVATATTTPAITLSTTITGVLSGNGTAIAAATTTGTGSVVLAESPTLTTPDLGVATATSINKVAITAPATAATLTIANNKTLTASNSLTLAGTDGTTLTFQGSDIYVGRATADTLTNKTIDADGTGNSITNIENADIKAAAAIALNKLAATTVSRALVSDASGFVTAATTTAAEIGFVNGVTSAIQTQINAIIQGSKSYASFTPIDNQPPATNFATPDTRNSLSVLDFDDTTGEDAIFVRTLPQNANVASGLKVRVHWMATSATSGDVAWVVSFMNLNGSTDIDTASFDTSATASTTAPGTSGFTAVTEITITTIASLTAGDSYRLKVSRNPSADNMVGDAEIHTVDVWSAA